MARRFDNNVANYMSRSSVNFGLNGLTEYSVGVWMNITADTGLTQRIVSKQFNTRAGIPFRINFDATGITVGAANDTLLQSPDWVTAIPSYGVWTRYLFTYKRNAITSADGVVYYNGVAQTITTFTANGYAAGFTLEEQSNNWYYGIRPVTLVDPVNGSLGWVCVWNRQLTAAEALQDYANPLSVTSGLVHAVQIDQDKDQTANGNDMSVVGTLAPVVDPVAPKVNVSYLRHPSPPIATQAARKGYT